MTLKEAKAELAIYNTNELRNIEAFYRYEPKNRDAVLYTLAAEQLLKEKFAHMTGWLALEAKRVCPSFLLCKFADPLTGPEEDLNPEAATEVCKVDPNLIYLK